MRRTVALFREQDPWFENDVVNSNDEAESHQMRGECNPEPIDCDWYNESNQHIDDMSVFGYIEWLDLHSDKKIVVLPQLSPNSFCSCVDAS